MKKTKTGYVLGKRLIGVIVALSLLLAMIPAVAAEKVGEAENDPKLTMEAQTFLSFQTTGDSKQYSLDQGTTWTDYLGTATLTGSSQGGSIDIISGAHDLVLDGLSITASSWYAMKVSSGATANLTLKNQNVLSTNSFLDEYCAIEVPEGATLRIGGAGELVSAKFGMTAAAAIGSHAGAKCGTIEITGGTIFAQDLTGLGPGIGSDTGGTVYVSGGSVNATILPRPAVSATQAIPVYRTTVLLQGTTSGTSISDAEVDTKQGYSYGKSGLKTDRNALYFWLPQGAVTTSATDADGTVYQEGGPITTTEDDKAEGTLRMPKKIIYLGGEAGSDTNNGSSPALAVATATKAVALAESGDTIVVCGDTEASLAQTRVEGKTLTFTNTDGEATYGNPVLSMRQPYFASDVTLHGITWQQAGGNAYCSVGANATLILDTVTPIPQSVSYIQGNTGAHLLVRNSTLSGAISGLLVFDSIELDASTATALENSSLPNDASDVILKNGSTLSVSKIVTSLTSVGEGNTLQARKLSGNPKVPTPVSVVGPITVENGKPLTVSSFFQTADGRPFIQSGHESLTLDQFILADGGFVLAKRDTTLCAVSAAVSTEVPLEITETGCMLRGQAATSVPLDSATFLWWAIGKEGEKQSLTAALNGNAFTVSLSGLNPGTLYGVQANSLVGGAQCPGNILTFRTKPQVSQPPTGSIGGSVTNNTGGASTITVTIEEGNTIRATQVLESVEDQADAPFSFTALPDGFYNVVADNGAYKVTRLVEIKGGEAVVDVALALGKTQSVVEIVTPDTPPAAVDGLPKQFEEKAINPEEGYTTADETVVQSGGTVELKLAVERKEETLVAADAALIAGVASGQTIPIYLDLSVFKTVIPTSGVATKTTLVSVPKLLTVVFPLPEEAVGKKNVTIYRVHSGVAQALPKTDPGANEEWAEITGENAILHVRQFSTYALGYTKSTGGGGSTTYPPILSLGENGSGIVSPQNPSFGSTVTITATPEDGYVVDKVVVTDKDGKELPVKDNGDGTYTITQPAGTVTITISFRPSSPSRPVWNPFVDVAEKDWFYNSVKYVYENGLMLGTTETTFGPHKDTSRGMIVTILWRIEGEPDGGTQPAYPDVLPSAYYYDAVNWADQHGIVLGYPDGKFAPENPITREQLSAILWRYAQYKQYDVSVGENTNILSYLDFKKISEYAFPALQWAGGNKIIYGRGDGMLEPKGTATRAEAATMLERFFMEVVLA